MGYTAVSHGDNVIGIGRAPDNGANINGKRGIVTDVRAWMGDDVLEVTWADGSVNDVRQENVSGTQTGVFGRQAAEEPESPSRKRRWGRK